MKLQWQRQDVVRMTARVEELATLLAGARIAAKALDKLDDASGAELRRVLGDLDRAVAALHGRAAPDAGPFFHEGSRALQDRFHTRPIADRIESLHVHDRLTGNDEAFIDRMDTFFIATADEQGRPNCSHKGGAEGFVRVIDERTIAFPSYDGNGMYLSMGNLLRNPNVGLLFIDFERAHRMRLNGVASIDDDDELMAEYPEAEFVVRVAVREVFPNCPRYIHRRGLIERSEFVPKAGHRTPEPDWKREDWAIDVLHEKTEG